jgi:predicted ester cyclase
VFATEFHSAFPNAKFDIDDVIVEGEKVVVRYTFRGKHEGNYCDIAPTNKEVTATGIRFSRVADGKLQETWNYLDKLSILTQLGWWEPPEDWQLAYTWGQSMAQAIAAAGDLGEQKILARRGLKELWDTGDLAIADEVYADGFTNHEITHRQFGDLVSYKKYVSAINHIMRDFRVVIEDLIAEGDKVAVRWKVNGTEETTGNEYAWGGITIFRFSDHKIIEAWWGRDALSIAQQMGLAPI